MKEFLESKQFIVYNVKYEWSASLSFFKDVLNSPIDALMIGRTLLDGGRLKEVASRRLGILEWDTLIDDYIGSLSTIIADLYITSKPKKEYELIVGGIENFANLLNCMEEMFNDSLAKYIEKTRRQFLTDKSKLEKNVVFNTAFWEHNLDKDVTVEYLLKKYPLSNLYADASTKKQYAFMNAVKSVDDFLKNNLSNRYNEYSKLLFKLIIEHVNNRTNINYCQIPLEILSLYNMKDVYYTDLLYDSYMREVNEKGLQKATQMMINQGNLSAELETNGLGWDEEYAKKCAENYELDFELSLRVYPDI
jgi:hypothetical protein